MGVRRNQAKLSAAEKARFVTAVKRMKSDTGQPHNYDKFVRLHALVAASPDPDVNPAHSGPAFCPWHRYLLAKFEHDLQAADRAAGGDGTITLPYWDWTQDNVSSPNRQRGGMWHDDFMGGPGSPVSGSFSSWTLAPPDGGPLVRGLGVAPEAITDSLPRRQEVDRALDSNGFDCTPFSRTSPIDAGLPFPPAPAATATAGGTLAPGRYRVAVTYVNDPAAGTVTTGPITQGETRLSPETVVCLGGGCSPTNTHTAIRITSPPSSPGAIGYRIYVSTVEGDSSTLTLQGGLTALGTASVINALSAGSARPSVNTTASFRNLLEGWATSRTNPLTGDPESEVHNRAHLWVGGSMMPATSPNDPVFFLHHCNVDRLWAVWQFRHPGQNYPPIVPKVADPTTNRAEGLNDPMPPWNVPAETVRPIDVLNHTAITINGVSLGYTYDTDPPGVAVNVAP